MAGGGSGGSGQWGGRRAAQTSPLPPADSGKAPTETHASWLLATWNLLTRKNGRCRAGQRDPGMGWRIQAAPRLGKGR